MAIANGKPPACAQCGRRDPKGRVDERQTKEFYCLACWSSYESDRLIEYFDSEAELHAKCQQLAEMISQARHVLAFTGAGISTGAGNFNTICSGGLTGRFCERGACQGPLRHSGVGFGDDLPQKILHRAWAQTEAADLCLALGSSITVTPASEMPTWIARRHARFPDRRSGLVIVNLQATPCDNMAALRINGMVDDVMELVEAKLHKLRAMGG